MKINFLAVIAVLIFSLMLFQTAQAQSAVKIPAKESTLVAHIAKEANQADLHSKDDVYILVTIGKTDYLAELKSGTIISQKSAVNTSGGFYGEYVEVSINLLDKSKQETAQGSGQILKYVGGKWKRIALSEGDYQCRDVKAIPKSVLKHLQVECN